MKINKNAIIAFILVLVIVFSAFALLLHKSDIFDSLSKDKSSDTSKAASDDTTADTSNGGTGITTPARYIDADGYGYQTTAGVTAFFKTLKIPEEHKDYHYSVCGGKFSVHYEYPTVKAYGSFVLNVRYSTDGILWNDFPYNDDNYYSDNYFGNEYDDYQYIGKSADVYGIDTIVYISYTFVTNCSNPDEVLRDLKNNVFTVNDMFEPYLGYVHDPEIDGFG